MRTLELINNGIVVFKKHFNNKREMQKFLMYNKVGYTCYRINLD